jgi:hypothetical protein
MPAMTARAANKRETAGQPWAAGSTDGVFAPYSHLHNLLRDYARYYNRLRTHLSLNKDAPLGRPVQSHGVLQRLPHFGGLHHSFVRM